MPNAEKIYTSTKNSLKLQVIYDLFANPSLRISKPSTLEKVKGVRIGVEKKELEFLKERIGLNYDELADVLRATRTTLIAKKGIEKFSEVVSEAIISLADIYSFGYQVFGDEQSFNKWMKSPLQALGGETPLSLSDNEFGREEIRNCIGRIAYGVYS